MAYERAWRGGAVTTGVACPPRPGTIRTAAGAPARG